MTTQVTEPAYRCHPEHPLAEAINQLNPNGFELLDATPDRKWVQVAFDADEALRLDAVIDGDTPDITLYRWQDPVEQELWIPGAWLVEVNDAS